jgi:Ca2+/Na+ antiporter
MYVVIYIFFFMLIASTSNRMTSALSRLSRVLLIADNPQGRAVAARQRQRR